MGCSLVVATGFIVGGDNKVIGGDKEFVVDEVSNSCIYDLKTHIEVDDEVLSGCVEVKTRFVK